MSLSRRQVIAAIPAATLAAALPKSPAIAQDGRKLVTFWFGQANSDGQGRIAARSGRGLQRLAGQVSTSDRDQGCGGEQLLKVALVAGKGPISCKTAGPAYLTAIANAGQVLPLDGFAETYKWKDRFLPALLNTGVYGGKLYALPRDYESMHLFL